MRKLHIVAFSGRCSWAVLPRTILCVAAAVVLATFSRPAEAMFVTPPEEKEMPPQIDEEAVPPELTEKSSKESSGLQASPPSEAGRAPAGRDSSLETVLPEDAKLEREISRIITSKPEKKNVNSRAFARMSGEVNKLKPVTLPVLFVEQRRVSRAVAHYYSDPGDKVFSVGSWIFVFLCLIATAVALIRIRKLTSHQE